MKIHLKSLRLMPSLMCCLMVMQPTMTFSAYPFLMPMAYLTLGLCILSCIIMGILSCKQPKSSVFDATVFLYCLCLTLFSILNLTDIRNAFYTSAVIMLLILLFHYYQHNLRLLLMSIAVTFSACIYANVVQIILYPESLFAANDAFSGFLLGGNYNQMGCRLLCGIVCSSQCIRYHKLWIVNTILLTIFSVTLLGIVGSMTSLSCILLFIALSLIPSRRLQLLAIAGYFVFYILFHAIVVFSGEGLYNNNLARYVIVELLGKDMTFTNRTHMWDAALHVIGDSPLFGYGHVDKEWYLANMDSSAIGPHNFILGTLIFGGVILLILFVTAAAVALRRIISTSIDKAGLTLLTGIMTLLFMMSFEYYHSFFIILLLTLAYYYPMENQTVNINEVTKTSLRPV